MRHLHAHYMLFHSRQLWHVDFPSVSEDFVSSVRLTWRQLSAHCSVKRTYFRQHCAVLQSTHRLAVLSMANP
jgi:hypothetical protein